MSNASELNLSRDLSNLPRVDKSQFITLYVETQKANAKCYALQGRAFMSSWDYTNVEGDPAQCSQGEVQALGFDTPVLKPRKSEPKRTTPTFIQTPSKKHSENRPIIGRKENKRKHSEIKFQENKAGLKPRQMKRKQPSDHEHQSRLKERNDRKRAKRVIVNSPDVEHEVECYATKKTKKRNAKYPPGFALMHGFSATNIGSSRLTMKRPVGVFNKGKASAKTSTVNKKGLSKRKVGPRSSGFSEEAFLSNQLPNETMARNISLNSSTSVSGTDVSSKIYDEPGKHDVEHKGLKACSIVKDRHRPAAHRRPSSSVSESQPVDMSRNLGNRTLCRSESKRVESIIWDIELDDASLPSRGASGSGNGAAIPNVRNLEWSSLQGENLAADYTIRPVQPKFGSNHSAMDVRPKSSSHSSIGPSQSASQYCRAVPRPGARSQLPSKYFVTTKLQTEEPHLLQGTIGPKLCSTPEDLGTNSSKQLVSIPETQPSVLIPVQYHPPAYQADERYNGELSSIVEDFPELGFQDINPSAGNSYLSMTDTYFEELRPLYGQVWGNYMGPFCDEAGDHQDALSETPFGTSRWTPELEATMTDAHPFDPHYLDSRYFANHPAPPLDENCPVENQEGRYLYINHSGEDQTCGEVQGCNPILDRDYWERGAWGSSFDGSDETFGSGSDSQFHSRYSSNDNESMLDTKFLQGRQLLLGYLTDNITKEAESLNVMQALSHGEQVPRRQVSLVEADVAKRLRNHWHPQRF